MKEQKSMLEYVAEDLAKKRKEEGICPSQKSGKEISGDITTFCVIPACSCEYKGRTRIFDMGECKMAYHVECKYEGKNERN